MEIGYFGLGFNGVVFGWFCVLVVGIGNWFCWLILVVAEFLL